MEPIGYIKSCYKEKFGIPRQPGLVDKAQGQLHLLEPYACPDSVRGLEAFSHLWLIFQFHATAAQGWQPTVRPPRLGGNEKLGVFATRSMFRPNALGLSVVKLEQIDTEGIGVVLHLSGLDLLDSTPVLDIKPYLPYADCLTTASGGFAAAVPVPQGAVVFTAEAQVQCHLKTQQWAVDIAGLVEQILLQDPRPSYRQGKVDDRIYGMRLYDFDVRWCYGEDQVIEVLELK